LSKNVITKSSGETTDFLSGDIHPRLLQFSLVKPMQFLPIELYSDNCKLAFRSALIRSMMDRTESTFYNFLILRQSVSLRGTPKYGRKDRSLLLVHCNFNVLEYTNKKVNGNLFGYQHLFKISYFIFSRRKTCINFRKDTRV